MLGFVSKTLLSSCDGVIPLRKNLRATSFIHDVLKELTVVRIKLVVYKGGSQKN